MDLSPLLYVPDTGSARRSVLPKNEMPSDMQRTASATASSSRCWRACSANPDAPVRLAHKIDNTQRTVGARLAGQLALRYGDAGLAGRPGPDYLYRRRRGRALAHSASTGCI